MNRFTLLAIVTASAFTSPSGFASAPALASPLVGTWIEQGGPGAARIQACPKRPDALCAFGIARRADGSLSAPRGIVLEDVVPAGTNRWKGRYIEGSRRLPATLSMEGAHVVAMRVCLLVVCQTARYERIG